MNGFTQRMVECLAAFAVIIAMVVAIFFMTGCGTTTDKAGDDWGIKVTTSVKADECTAECETDIRQTLTAEDEEAIDRSGTIEVLKGTAVP